MLFVSLMQIMKFGSPYHLPIPKYSNSNFNILDAENKKPANYMLFGLVM